MKFTLLFFFLAMVLFLNSMLTDQSHAEADQALLYKGKIWQKIGSGKPLNWNDANQYCQDLVLNDYSDWRLPSQHAMEELIVCTKVPPPPPPKKPEDIIMGFKSPECKEDLNHGGGGRINPAFKLHMTKDFGEWQSRYWTSTSGFARNSMKLKSDVNHPGYFYVFFLYDVRMSNCSPPSELNFVRCVHDQSK
ncbi:MAG: DUF1566 domain-containing protein [Proteobacteria bacterium]|nr:DUF1566 domain-containing protein [Pseudomonadota bacterium]